MSSRTAHASTSGFRTIRTRSDGHPWALLSLALVCALVLSGPLRGEQVADRLPPVSSDVVPTADHVMELNGEDRLAEDEACVAMTQCSGATTYLFSELLFWTVREGSAENWAQEITPQGLGTTFGTATLVDAPFDWNAGLRVGLGYQTDDNGYDVKLCYTNFQTQANNVASGEVYSAFLGNFYVGNPDGTGFGPHYQNASIEWEVAFHTIDLEIGHTFTIDESLALRPFAGIKAAIIQQSIHSTWQHPIDTLSQTYLFNSATENLKQDFWGIGPSIGVTASMPIYTHPRYSLKLYGTPSGALMYGNWKFKDHYQNDGPTSTTVPTPTSIAINTSPIEGAATMARGAVGIEWTRHFSRATTTVRFGYEAQVWLNQMQYYSFNMGRLNNLMSLQGGVLELGISF